MSYFKKRVHLIRKQTDYCRPYRKTRKYCFVSVNSLLRCFVQLDLV